MAKPTRSMPQIDQEQGDSMDEGEGHEEWLSDGGYTDDDTMNSQEQDEDHSATQDTLMEENPQPKTPVEETVENINNQLQLEINIGEDGVAIIRRQAVRVSDAQSTSPQKASPTKDPPKSPAPSKDSEAAAKSYALAASSASEGIADEEQDPEKLLDQLETFLIRKTDGKVLETKATVQTTLNDLVKKTVYEGDSDELADDDGDGADDGNDTDDLLSVLDDTATRRTTRSLAKLQQADTPSTQKGKANAKTSKQVTKTAESSSKANSSMSRSATKSPASATRKSSQDNKPVIISNKVVHLSTKSSSHKKSNSTQKSTPTKSDKNKSKIDNSILTSPEADDDLLKHFATKNKNQSIKQCEVKIEKIEPKKYVPLSNSNFGDTYNSFIQKKQSDILLNKPLGKKQKSFKKVENVPSLRTYKRAASTLVESVRPKKIDPFDKLLKGDDNENDTIGKRPKIKRLSVDSSIKSSVPKKPLLITDSSPKVSKTTKEIVDKSPSLSNKSLTISNKSLERTNKILTILEKNSALSVKSTSNTKISNMQPITRKIVTGIPRTQSPKIQPPKTQSPKIQPPKTQSPKIQPAKIQSPKLQQHKIQSPVIQNPVRKIAEISSKTVSKNNISTKVRPITPIESKIIEKQKSIMKHYNQNKTMQIMKTYSNKAKGVVVKEESNRSKVKDDTSEDDDMNSNLDDHDMNSMPKWPGDDDDEEEEDEEAPKPLTRPQQRLQEGISKEAGQISAKLADDDDEMDDGSSEFDSDDMDGSDYNDMSPSEPESLQQNFFTIDLRDERATEYLPMLGSKAQEILEREKRSLLQKISTIQQGLKSLYNTTKQNQIEVDSAKLKIIELNALLRQP